MDVNYQNRGDYGVLKYVGDLTGGESAAVLLNGVESHIKEYEGKKCVPLILDLSRTSFISSSGIGSLITATKMLRKNCSDIKLCNLSDRVYNSLVVLTQMHDVFKIYPTEEEAVQSSGLESKVVQRKV